MSVPGIVDDHAHPFPLAQEALDLAEISLDVDGRPGASERRHALGPGRLSTEAIRVRLAGFLDCAPEEVEAAREQAARDWPAYVRRLFADVGVTGMLLDGGSHPLSAGDLARAGAVGGISTWSLFRLESVIDPMLAAGASADEVLAGLDKGIADAAAGGAVGCKTVLAYRTGLAVAVDVSLADARASVEDTELPVPRRAKALRDLAFRRSLAQCAELGLPIQVHTGYGDSEIRLADANPLGLDDVLRTPEAEPAQVVLIHAGYPWHEQVAYLAAVRSSVWAEFSLVNLLNPATSADRLLRLVELAPTDRILTGSDGHGAPETHWQALWVLREAWAEVRQRLGGVARGAWLDGAESAILAENARALYRLS
ncbi:MAG: amidohydrolase [Actinomycetota bacterium]|nr:amidohydrolase [Actinomycetota bacterium]